MQLARTAEFAAATTTSAAHETVGQSEAETPSGIAALGIDPSFLFVQIVNFLILFALLRWALYRPMLAMLNARREKIEKGVRSAEESERAAKAAEEQTAALLKSARQEAETIITEARQSAEKLAAEVKATANAESAVMLERTRTQLEAEKTALLADVETHIGELVAVAASKLVDANASYDESAVKSAVDSAKETLA